MENTLGTRDQLQVAEPGPICEIALDETYEIEAARTFPPNTNGPDHTRLL